MCEDVNGDNISLDGFTDSPLFELTPEQEQELEGYVMFSAHVLVA